MSAPSAPANPKLVGASVKRVEDPRFLTGRGRYTDDTHEPGTVEVAFLRSSVAHARIVSIDVERAVSMPGVHAVVTGEELNRHVRPIVGDPYTDVGWQSSEYPVLARSVVRYVGECIAAVVADDRYLAEDALEEIAVEYEPLPVVASLEAAMADDAPVLHEGWKDNVFARRQIDAGDVEEAFAGAHGVLERETTIGRQTAMPIETRVTVATFDPSQGDLVVRTTTQVPHLLRTGLADLLGLPEQRVRVISPDVGGGFGIKGHVYPEDLAISYLAMRLERPVKWVEDRREHLLSAVHAREHVHRIAAAYDADGTIRGLKAEMYVDSGAYSVYPYTAAMEAGMAMGVLPGMYRIRNYACRAYAVATNKTPLGPYRGVARPSACFSMERIVDEVARELGLDPVEVRRRNLIGRDEFPYTTATDLVYDSGDFEATLDKACETLDYAGLRERQREAREQGRLLGIGIGCYVEQTAHATAEFVKRGTPIVFGYEGSRVRMDPSGRIVVQVTSHSHGQGHETTFAQLVCDVLGVPIEDVKVEFGDTTLLPYGTGTIASRSLVMAGGAAHIAASQVRQKLTEFAAHLLEVDPSDLTVADGAVGVKGSPSHRLELADLARWAYHRPEKLPEGMEPTLEATATYEAGPGTGTFSNAVHLALVEVDPSTGAVDVQRYVVAEDCGRVVNPMIVDGQVAGGVVQGLGGALMEEIVYDGEGQPLTTALMDYLMPLATDVPTVEVAHVETLSPFTVGGMKGMGEGGAIAPGPVIAGAVQDALAPLDVSFVGSIPVTPSRVAELIREAQDRRPGV